MLSNNKRLYNYIDEKIKEIDSSVLSNKGKDFPLIEMERDGITSLPNTTLNRALLDVKIISTSDIIKNHYFQINYFQNNGVIGGKKNNGLRVLMYERATYSSSSTPIIIQAPEDRDLTYSKSIGGVYTEEFICSKNKDIKVILTLDVSSMPREGIALRMSLNNDRAWSWVIDPINYVSLDTVEEEEIETDEIKSLSPIESNKNKRYPFREYNTLIEESDIYPVPNLAIQRRILDVVDNGILDIKVFAPAEKLNNKLIKIDYIYYGVFSSDYLQFSISSYDKDVYTKSTTADQLNSTRVSLISRSTNIADIDLNNNEIEVYRFPSSTDPEISFEITIDMAVLNKYHNNSISMWANTGSYSYLVTHAIDESNYYLFGGSSSKSVTEYNDFVKRTKITGIMSIGASLMNSVNGWIERTGKELNIDYFNKAIGGYNPYDFVDIILNKGLCTDEEFEKSDALIIQFASSKDLNNFSEQTRNYLEYEVLLKGVVRSEIPTLISQGEALDFILKWWQFKCEEQEKNPSSKWFNIVGGKPLRYVFATHWHDAREYYNTPIREVSKKWGGVVCEFDRLIGFSKETPNSSGNQISLQYAMDTQTIDGVLYGWHPKRMIEGEFIQNKMSNIFLNTLVYQLT